MKVEIYSKTDCIFCQQAKQWFKENHIHYQETILDNEKERLDFYQKISNGKVINSVPQIFIEGDHIGGYNDLMAHSDVILKQKYGGLLKPSKTYKPFVYPWAVEYASESENAHWTEFEVDLAEDINDWKSGKMTVVEKEYVTNILRFFTQMDVNVAQNYIDYYLKVFKNNEIRMMLLSFAAREGIHMRSYALLNESLGIPDNEYSTFLEIKEMLEKHEYMIDIDIHSKKGIALSIAKSVFNEGVSLFASFAMLLNFQRRGLLKGVSKIAEWSLRDEQAHVTGMTKLFKTFCSEHPRIVNDELKKEIYEMSRIIVKLEDIFIDYLYQFGEVEGLTSDELKNYIRYIADRRLIQMGLKGNFKVKENPLEWLDYILNGADFTNFFENKVTEYDVAGLKGDWEYSFINLVA